MSKPTIIAALGVADDADRDLAAAAAVANARATLGETDAAVPLSLATAFEIYRTASLGCHAAREAARTTNNAHADAAAVDAIKTEVKALDAYYDLARAAAEA